MKKILSLLLSFMIFSLICVNSFAVSDYTTIPTKTLNNITDDFRKALKNGETSVQISQYGVYDSGDNTEYYSLLNVLTMLALDVQGFSFGKYTELVTGIDVNMNSSTRLLTGITIKYPDIYMTGDGKCDVKKLDEDRKLVSKRYREAQSIVKRDMTDLEKALALYDYVITICEYPEPTGTDSSGEETYPESMYQVTGILRDEQGVCSAYAKLYALLLNDSGVPAVTVASDVMNHEWVMLKIDGEWYHADPTWDDPKLIHGYTVYLDPNDDNWDIGAVSHDYFLKSDEEIKELEHTDWYISYTVNPDYLTEAPVSGSSGKFDDMFFSDKNSDIMTFSPLCRVNGNWYIPDLKSSSVIMTTIDGEPEYIKFTEENEYLKYSFGYGNELYVNTNFAVYRFDTIKDRFEKIIEIPEEERGSKGFTEMNVRYGELSLTTVTFTKTGEDEYDYSFLTDVYTMEEMSDMEAIPDEADTSTVNRSGEDEETAEFTKPVQNRNPDGTAAETTISVTADNISGSSFNILYIVIPGAVVLIIAIVLVVIKIKNR